MLEEQTLSAEQQTLFKTLFLNDIPMLDLRSPGEFDQGAFPSSKNIPLMTNEQRAQVGTCYKEHGQNAAIELGHQLVSGEIRELLMHQWQDFFHTHPEGWLYCFRGGLRSKTVAAWLEAEGVSIKRIEGGYKALRRYLINAIEEGVINNKLWIIGGQTGTAKTHFINRWQESIDLEGLANHRGSSFGRRPQGQPGNINFENMIAIALLKISESANQLVLEDEGVTIGSCSMPIPLRKAMQKAPVLLLKLDFESRVETILNDYVIHLADEFKETMSGDYYAHYMTAMLDSLARIKKRLGGERYKDINADLKRALEHKDKALHRIWIAKLLELYYDPMYQYQLHKKSARIIVDGTAEQLSNYLLNEGLTPK